MTSNDYKFEKREQTDDDIFLGLMACLKTYEQMESFINIKKREIEDKLKMMEE